MKFVAATARAAMLFAVSACSLIPGTDAHLEEEAREALRFTLLDADTARFERLKQVPAPAPHKGKLLCGMVNARTRAGGYGGYTQFLAFEDGEVLIDPQEDSGAAQRAFNSTRRAGRRAGCSFLY